MKLDIIGIAETRWTDNGCVKRDDYIFIYSGGVKHQHGVGMLIRKDLEKHILGYWTLNERMMLYNHVWKSDWKRGEKEEGRSHAIVYSVIAPPCGGLSSISVCM